MTFSRDDFALYEDPDGAIGPVSIWRHRTNDRIFSTDGGETYYDLSEELGHDGEAVIHTTK